MASCEKCWADAYLRAKVTGKPHMVCYAELLRECADNPCSPKEQAGQWWDEEKQIDTRKI